MITEKVIYLKTVDYECNYDAFYCLKHGSAAESLDIIFVIWLTTSMDSNMDSNGRGNNAIVSHSDQQRETTNVFQNKVEN